MEILVNKCGLDAVKAVIPEEHMKLLTNIRKVIPLFSAAPFSLQSFTKQLTNNYPLIFYYWLQCLAD